MIRHILLIQFKSTAQPAQLDSLRDLFFALGESIEGVSNVEWGQNDSPEGKNKHYTHVVMMTFADEAARQRYLAHPEHDALKAVFIPLLEDIVVVDYPA